MNLVKLKKICLIITWLFVTYYWGAFVKQTVIFINAKMSFIGFFFLEGKQKITSVVISFMVFLVSFFICMTWEYSEKKKVMKKGGWVNVFYRVLDLAWENRLTKSDLGTRKCLKRDWGAFPKLFELHSFVGEWQRFNKVRVCHKDLKTKKIWLLIWTVYLMRFVLIHIFVSH